MAATINYQLSATVTQIRFKYLREYRLRISLPLNEPSSRILVLLRARRTRLCIGSGARAHMTELGATSSQGRGGVDCAMRLVRWRAGKASLIPIQSTPNANGLEIVASLVVFEFVSAAI